MDKKQREDRRHQEDLALTRALLWVAAAVILEGLLGDYMFDYKGKRWKDLAARAMRRDGYMCQLSKRYGKQVPAELVHHIYPVDEYPEYSYCLWNLISLSRAVYNTLHDRNTDKLTADGIALMRRTKPK